MGHDLTLLRYIIDIYEYGSVIKDQGAVILYMMLTLLYLR